MTVTLVPIPSDAYHVPSFIMTQLHHVIEPGFHNILDLLHTPPLDDLGRFLGYCDAWTTVLLAHHDVEENSMFPILNAKLDFSRGTGAPQGDARRGRQVHHLRPCCSGRQHDIRYGVTSRDPRRCKGSPPDSSPR
ncbi:hypothetical protein V1504DRAFT_332486 [Lipomyces starkeyi]